MPELSAPATFITSYPPEAVIAELIPWEVLFSLNKGVPLQSVTWQSHTLGQKKHEFPSNCGVSPRL